MLGVVLWHERWRRRHPRRTLLGDVRYIIGDEAERRLRLRDSATAEEAGKSVEVKEPRQPR